MATNMTSAAAANCAYAKAFGLDPAFVTRFVRKGDGSVEFHLMHPNAGELLGTWAVDFSGDRSCLPEAEVSVTVTFRNQPQTRRDARIQHEILHRAD